MKDNREYIQFDKSFGNNRYVRIIVPAESQNLSRAECEEMLAVLEEFMGSLRAVSVSAARKVDS